MSLANHLRTLESSGLVRLAVTQPDLEYLFRHALVRDAAYSSLLEPDRKRLHRAVGEALEEMYPERREELAPQLARHFAEAGNHARALTYFLLAGDSALAAYANHEAESHYRAALNLTPTPQQQAHALFGMGRALARQSRYVEAISVWGQAIPLCQASGDSNSVARLYALSSRAAWHNSDVRRGLDLALEGLAAVEGAPESHGLAALIHEAARAYVFNHEPVQARALGAQALAMAERLGAVDVQAETLSTLGILFDQPPPVALNALTRAVELAETTGLIATAARAHLNLGGLILRTRLDIAEAQTHFQRAIELAHRQGVVSEELIYRLALDDTAFLTGDLDSIEAHLTHLRQLAVIARGHKQSIIALKINEVRVLHGRGYLTEARQLLIELLPSMRQDSDRKLLRWMLGHLAELLIEMGEWREAASVVDDLINQFGSTEEGKEYTNPHLAQCEILTHQGQFTAAHVSLNRGKAISEANFSLFGQIRQRFTAARLAVAEQRWNDAFTAFETVCDQLARAGCRWHWARALRDWAAAHIAHGEPSDLERARALLRKALALFEQMRAPGYIARVQDQLENLSAAIYAQALIHQRSIQELAMAGEIQAGLLPGALPEVPGWELAAVLDPARQTAGDFYDCIKLPNGCLGIVIADVADKGAGAALYMALSRTLIRTYAGDYAAQPEQVLNAVNRRMLQDTAAALFVTAFYGVFDPASGVLTYCNAGHNPPLIFNPATPAVVRELRGTGMALGVVAEGAWHQRTIQLGPGDLLLLYTDGVIEAQNRQDELFGIARLLDVTRTNLGRSAQAVRDAIIAEVYAFANDAPQFDDITVMVVQRTREAQPQSEGQNG